MQQKLKKSGLPKLTSGVRDDGPKWIHLRKLLPLLLKLI
jgi:hypothetical protein